MAKKHIIDYYNQICEDYHEMIETLKDMEKECEQGIISPDRVDQLKRMIEPIKINYNRISYIMFLLNMPQRDKKKAKYIKQNKISIPEEDTLDGVREENKQALIKAKSTLL